MGGVAVVTHMSKQSMNRDALEKFRSNLHENDMLKVREFAGIAGLTARAVSEKCQAGEITYYDHGQKSIRIRWGDGKKYLGAQRVEAIL